MSNWRKKISYLFQAHHRQLESLVRKRVGSADTAADLVQDVFLRTLAAGPRASDEDDRRVLYASARNAAIEHHRTHRRRSEIISSLVSEQLVAPSASPEAGLQARQTLAVLEETLNQLSPRCREIFILRRVDGLSNEEIARKQGISVNSVEKHISRALRHCQARLAEHLRER